MPASCVRRPFQKVGQVPGSVVPGSQVLRYGPRTASGTAGGRIGWVAEGATPPDLTTAATAAPEPAAATTAPEASRKLRRLRRSAGSAGDRRADGGIPVMREIIPNYAQRPA